jgi:hypothetical protein
MNQAWLSQLPLASVPIAYELREKYEPHTTFAHLCETLCGKPLGNDLLRDIAKLQDAGLRSLTEEEKTELREHYHKFPNNPYAREIVDWLNGEYQFDPACLTE